MIIYIEAGELNIIGERTMYLGRRELCIWGGLAPSAGLALAPRPLAGLPLPPQAPVVDVGVPWVALLV